jgi:hypothetical protein
MVAVPVTDGLGRLCRRGFPDGQDFSNPALLFPGQWQHASVDDNLVQQGRVVQGPPAGQDQAAGQGPEVSVPKFPEGAEEVGSRGLFEVRFTEEQVVAVVGPLPQLAPP